MRVGRRGHPPNGSILTRHLAGPRDLPPHLQYDIAVVIVDILLVPDCGSRVHLVDQPLEIHRHRAPTSAGGVASPGRAFAGASIEKRDAGGADGGGGRTRAASSDAWLGVLASGVLFDEEAAPRFIDPRRRRVCPCGGCVGGNDGVDSVNVGLKDDDGVGVTLGYVAARGGSVARSDGDAGYDVVVVRSRPLTSPLLSLASRNAAGGGQGRGGDSGSSDGGSGGGGDARCGAEPSGRTQAGRIQGYILVGSCARVVHTRARASRKDAGRTTRARK